MLLAVSTLRLTLVNGENEHTSLGIKMKLVAQGLTFLAQNMCLGSSEKQTCWLVGVISGN
jgi:hypothetical protein